MKVSVDTSELLKSLEEAKQKIKSRLETMVQDVVYHAIAEPAIDITPYGDLEQYYNYYKYRSERFGLPMSAGLAKGGWNVRTAYGSVGAGGSVNTTSSTFGIMAGMVTDTESGSLSKSRIQAQLEHYNLGEPVIIYNRVPYMVRDFNGIALEKGSSRKAPQGIRQPTIDAFIGLYKSIMQRSLS